MDLNPTRKRMLVVLKWAARIWSLPAIWFLSAELLFPHADAANEENIWMLVCLGIMIVSVFALALAWVAEKIGGWLSLGGLILFFIVYGLAAGEFFPAYWLFLLFVAGPAGLFLLRAYSITYRVKEL